MAAPAEQPGPFSVERGGVRGVGTVALVAPSEPEWYRDVLLNLCDVLNAVHQRRGAEHKLHGEPSHETPPEETGDIFEVRPDE